MEVIVAALVTGLFALALKRMDRRMERHGRAVDTLAGKLQTNHGEDPSYYLELIAEVHAKQDRLVELLAAHTVQDEVNFKTIEKRLDAMSAA